MSDASNDNKYSKNGVDPNWRKQQHPTHFPTPDVGAKLDFVAAVKHDQGRTQQYLQFHKDTCEKLIKITAAKNADYAGGSDKDDPFANFKQVENMGICSTEIGFLTRMTDKISRLITFTKKGMLQVKDESVEDTLLDLANYCILMAGYIKSKKEIQK